MTSSEIIVRRAAATSTGHTLGRSRDLRGTPIGVRTGRGGVLARWRRSGRAERQRRCQFRRRRPHSLPGVLTGIGDVGRDRAAEYWQLAPVLRPCGWPIVAAGALLVFVLVLLGGPLECIGQLRLGAPLRQSRETADTAKAFLEVTDPTP